MNIQLGLGIIRGLLGVPEHNTSPSVSEEANSNQT